MQGKLVTGLVPALLVLLFTYTGSSKLFALETFRSTLLNQPIPHILTTPLMILIPVAEILVAAGLLFDRTKRVALLVALALLICFTLYIFAIVLRIFHKIPCPCGGIFRGLSWPQHLLVNLLFMGFTIIALTKKPIRSSSLNTIL